MRCSEDCNRSVLHMQIIEIPVYSISVQLESAIRKKELKEDQISQAFNALSAKKKKQKTPILILVIVISVFALIMGAGIMIGGDNIILGLVTMLLFLAAAAVAGFIGYHVNVGKTAKQWNALLKEKYPDICGKYKL